jgi:hypothetical protein
MWHNTDSMQASSALLHVSRFRDESQILRGSLAAHENRASLGAIVRRKEASVCE